MPRVFPAAVLLCLISGTPTTAQTVALDADLLFYADNTEFFNPFRQGETLLGTAGRVYLSLEVNEAVTLRGGIFANGRYGAHEFVEHGEPTVALEIRRGDSRFIFGSLETSAWRVPGRGPDREGPHGLLPPLQQETLTFRRPHDMGLQWLVTSGRLRHDTWLAWQRLNQGGSREMFEAGYRGVVRAGGGVDVHGSWHVVHEGGQHPSVAPVRDSQAATLGAAWAHGAADAPRFQIEAHGLVAREDADRDRGGDARTGVGGFARVESHTGGWRLHALAWRGDGVFKQEGDANYLSRRRDGAEVRGVRDYAELGLARVFQPAPDVNVQASFRLHRIERHYEYSYRIVARVRLHHEF